MQYLLNNIWAFWIRSQTFGRQVETTCHILIKYFINQENIKVFILRKGGPYEETKSQN